MRRTGQVGGARVAGVLVVAVLLGGCASSTTGRAVATGSGEDPSSSSEQPSGEPSGQPSGQPPAQDPTVSFSALALDAPDFPAPYEYDAEASDLSAGALAEALELASAAVYEPAECGTLGTATTPADLAEAGLAVAIDMTTFSSIAALVAPAGVELAEIDDALARCATYTAQLAVEDFTASVATTVEGFDPPEVGADDARGLRITTVTTVGGTEPVTQSSVQLIALVDEIQVSVNASGPFGGGPTDEAAAATVFGAGVAKVLEAG